MEKAMEHPNGTSGDLQVGLWTGMILGIIKLLDIYLLTDSYFIVCVKVAFTAVIGGLGGVAGKQLFFWLKNKYEQKFKKKIK